MKLSLSPKLLDVVQMKGAPFAAGEVRQGTIVEMLSPDTALIEVSDDEGVATNFVTRRLDEIEQVWELPKSASPTPKTDEAQSYFENGLLSLQNRLYERAKEQFGKSFALDPKYRGTLLMMTNQLAAKGSFDAAILVYALLLELSPDYTQARENLAIAHMNYGIFLARQGSFPLSMDNFLKALAVRPSEATIKKIRDNIAVTYTNLGVSYSNANQFQLALACFQRAFTIEPSDTSRKNLATAMISAATAGLGRQAREGRAELFKEPLLMGLTLSECLTAVGATLAALGETTEARLVTEAAVEADPSNGIAHHNLRILLGQTPEPERVQSGVVSLENGPMQAIA